MPARPALIGSIPIAPATLKDPQSVGFEGWDGAPMALEVDDPIEIAAIRAAALAAGWTD
jgi:hypothetical protein